MEDFLCGLFGGIVGTFFSHPVDTVRVAHQMSENSSIKITARDIISKFGYKGLYRGIVSPIIGIGFEKMLVFGTFYNLKQSGYDTNNFINGIAAGSASSIIVTPIEKIKIYRQTNTQLSQIKLNNIYRGFMATSIRESLGYGIYFSTYEYIKGENDSLIRTFLNGCFAGGFSWFFIYPTDIIKTHVQKEETYSQVIKHIYKRYGILGFFRGLNLALLRAVPLHGGVFLGYEFFKKLMN